LNPYPVDSVVDISFTTNQGSESPQNLQGLVVPGGGMLNVDLGTNLRRRTAIATTVTTRGEPVVAWETQWATPPAAGSVLLGTPAARNPLADPAWPVPGITVTLGSPSAGTRWSWPDGLDGSGIDEQYVVYNPSSATAEVKLSVGLAQGVAEPLEFSVGPDQVEPVVSQQQARIPGGVSHSAVIQSLNDVPVVAARTVVASPPSAWSGLGTLPGGRVAADDWLVPQVQTSGNRDGWVVVYNPGPGTANVVVMGLGGGAARSLPGLNPVNLGPGARYAYHINNAAPIVYRPIVVDASTPVYVESDLYGVNGRLGISLSLGVPLTS
jgi:hypothetical protein